jgi:hypothetical protein
MSRTRILLVQQAVEEKKKRHGNNHRHGDSPVVMSTVESTVVPTPTPVVNSDVVTEKEPQDVVTDVVETKVELDDVVEDDVPFVDQKEGEAKPVKKSGKKNGK